MGTDGSNDKPSEVEAWQALQACDLCYRAGPFSSCVHYLEFLKSIARSAVVASVTEEGFTQQIHFMQRQSQMLAEQGDDVASRVMAEAAQMVADVWKDRERYRQGMANWKATAEAKDREFAQSASEASVPEGCTPADAMVLREANHQLAEENHNLRRCLRFYANGDHYTGFLHWEGPSGDDNWLCPPSDDFGKYRQQFIAKLDEAMVEDGSCARHTLITGKFNVEDAEDEPKLVKGEPEYEIEQQAKNATDATTDRRGVDRG